MKLRIIFSAEYESEYELTDMAGKAIGLPEFKDQLKTMVLEDPDLLLDLKGVSVFCVVTNA